MFSTVLIVPAALRGPANALGLAIGYGPESYSLPLGADGVVTHYGAHTWATLAFFDLVAAARNGELPPVDWAAHGLTPAGVGQVLAALQISAPGSPLEPEAPVPAGPSAHFGEVLAALGLTRI
jgi:hypothetical protein